MCVSSHEHSQSSVLIVLEGPKGTKTKGDKEIFDIHTLSKETVMLYPVQWKSKSYIVSNALQIDK